jgi:hypothetical protein
VITDPRLEKKVGTLIGSISGLINNFAYREGPDLYFYRKTIRVRRAKNLIELLDDSEDRFIELLYATLVSWDMNSRGAKMAYFDEFKQSILGCKSRFAKLSTHVLDELSYEEFGSVKELLSSIYSDLNLMKTDGRLVSNSKIMHFILPDLVMPMDRENTLRFFFGNTGESPSKFMDIMDCAYHIARKVDLRRFLDTKWNQSIAKVIDNAIMSFMNRKYNIQK